MAVSDQHEIDDTEIISARSAFLPWIIRWMAAWMALFWFITARGTIGVLPDDWRFSVRVGTAMLITTPIMYLFFSAWNKLRYWTTIIYEQDIEREKRQAIDREIRRKREAAEAFKAQLDALLVQRQIEQQGIEVRNDFLKMRDELEGR